jgi:hypothetical protein
MEIGVLQVRVLQVVWRIVYDDANVEQMTRMEIIAAIHTHKLHENLTISLGRLKEICLYLRDEISMKSQGANLITMGCSELRQTLLIRDSIFWI